MSFQITDNIRLCELMQIDVNNLALLQKEKFTEHCINILRKVIELLEKGEYSQIGNMLRYSPAGDGMGAENHFIDFSYGGMSIDMADVIEILSGLERQINEPNKQIEGAW